MTHDATVRQGTKTGTVVPDPVPRLLSPADKLAKGAELAAEQGDMAAGVALITGAAQLVQLARVIERERGAA